MAALRVNRLHWPVTTLGYGHRVGLWVQGCRIGCPGCCSRDTWETSAGAVLAIDDVLSWIASRPLEAIDGFTISGGEPFDQPQALAELADALRGLDGRERDLLVYSGYPWRTLQRDHAALVARFDAVVSEPYVRTRPGAPLMGSDNQTLHRQTPLARVRYPEVASHDRAPPGKRLQTAWDGHRLWMIGIPAPGDLQTLQNRLAERGISIRDASWLV